MAYVTTERRGAVMVIRMDNPPVNALGHGLRTGLLDAVTAAAKDDTVKAVVVTGTGRFFSAGADITEFAKPRMEPSLPEVIDIMEAIAKPVVAAINGTALGGGLEVALGCHDRVVAKDVKQLGLPEVKIGILPGAGGTQRLPRLIGVEAALGVIVSGAPIDAAKAKEIGLVSEVVDGDVVAAAVSRAEAMAAQAGSIRRSSERAIDMSKVPADLFAKARAAAARHPSGPVAAMQCIASVEAATQLPFREGMKKERENFMVCAQTPYARALQYAFFAERQAANIPGIGPDVKLRDVKSVGVLGAGTMGAGIAIAFLQAGFPVTVVETKQDALDRGVARIRETIEGNVKRGRITADAGQKILAGLKPSLAIDAFASTDLVIEAVFENMAIKKEVFGKLDAACKPGAILATNTSTLDVDEIAQAIKRPQDVLGLHFFSPANIMRLLEIVRGAKTSDEVLATAMAISKKIGKVGVVAGVCFGFIGNRMVEAYMEEVQAMLLEGATPQDIDSAYEAWGFAMGPLAVMDLAGMDVGWRIRKEHAIPDERRRLYRVTDALVESGRHGQKTGKGIYLYGADRKRTVDPSVADMFRAEAARQGIAHRNGIPAEEIVERGLLRLINTGAQILDEGIALRASDIDTIYLNGYGFLAWRGGPMWQADAMDLKEVAAKIKGYEAKHGARWKIAPIIERLAAEGSTFAQVDKAKR
ncbi:MAG: enoyl-CoA hydratase/isomerase family protein [Hyphomicrobiales bacterium]|nr:enoyl-CoA hydratase/isomerase family protein [Hyphomicrobiales bacterium]